jgi:N-acetylglucosaminyldiphosphoundecaprenol N-acetyl-beta-D-mannosaminyltransferase
MNNSNVNIKLHITRYNFMGCPLDAYTVSDAILDITTRIKSRASVNLIHFLNVAKVVRAHTDQMLTDALWDGDLVLADGKPLISFGKLLGMNVPERVNGTNLMLDLFRVSANEGFSVYLLGAKQHVLERCVVNILKMYPKLRIAGYRNGYFKKDATDDVINLINTTSPDILFIGMSTPQKEFFAFENRKKFDVPIVQGVGGSFDVIAGLVKRAPVWMQDCGLEWFFRVLQEPKRMFWRYISTNTKFLVLYFANLVNYYWHILRSLNTK